MAPTSAFGLRSLTTGFSDSIYFADPPTSNPWLDRTVAAGGRVIVVGVQWSGITPNPVSPAELEDSARFSAAWAPTDALVRAATARGLTVVMTLDRAPAWADGPGRPANAVPGTWRPNPQLFAAFARGAARRYSGTFPDPARPGQALPGVRYWQAWTEPNLSTHLAPQWTRIGRLVIAAGPRIYKGLLNAFYFAVKSVRPTNVVVTAGTAPFGGYVGGISRMSPARFWRELFCIRDRFLHLALCPVRAHFDILAHHPYSVGPPTRHALNIDDVSIPDMYKLTRPLYAAVRTGRVLPRAFKRVWATEISYDSKPPDPFGVPSFVHARYVEDAFYLLWRSGVDVIAWFNIRDQDPVGGYGTTYQSGVFFGDGRPKPALTAFRFPFVTERFSRFSVRAWGRAPVSGLLQIQRLVGRSWHTIRAFRVGGNRVFLVTLGLAGRATLRAVIGSQASLSRYQG